MRADLGEPGQPELDRLVLAHHDDGRGTVGDLRGRPRRDRAVGGERRTEPAERLGGGVGADALVGGEHDRVALALRDLYRGDLLVEDPVLRRLRGELVGAGGECVLLLASQAQCGVVPLRGLAHRHVVECVGQAVVRHRVEHLDRAVLVALARIGEQVRRVRHRFHAAGDDDLELAGTDELVGERDRVEAGEADLVDRDRRRAHADAGFDRGLPGGDLPGAGLQDLAHDHVLDLLGRDAGALERGLDGEAAEVDGAEVLERTEQATHRRASARDDDRTGHGGLPDSR